MKNKVSITPVGDVEAELHARHSADRIGGEWFRYSTAIQESIDSMPKVELR